MPGPVGGIIAGAEIGKALDALIERGNACRQFVEMGQHFLQEKAMMFAHQSL